MVPHLASTAQQRSMDTALPVPRYEYTDDSAGSGEAESRARKRFLRTADENDKPVPRSSMLPPARGSIENKSTATAARRRSTLREHRPPSGPRPLDRDVSKRITSDSSAASAASIAANRSFLPTSTSEPFFGDIQAANTNNPRYSFGKSSEGGSKNSSGSFDFLPSVNFDDFQTSLALNEPALADFPAPGNGGRQHAEQQSPQRSSTIGLNRTQEPTVPRVGRSGSLLRGTGLGNRPVGPQHSSSTTSMPPPSAPLSLRTRQVPQPAPPPAKASARQPRKSVGPGLLTAERDTSSSWREAATGTADHSATSVGRSSSISKPNRRETLGTSLSSGPDLPRLSTMTRSFKAKSLQPPANKAQGSSLLAPSITPDPGFGSSIGSARSPGRSPGQGTQTPSSANKRRSVVQPSHVSGLGARTVSPTDARRLKRLSVMPNTPAVPQTPPTPQPDTIPDEWLDVNLPPVPTRKSATPSSARATPDTQRKTFGSRLSLSSSSSFSSLRTAAASFQNRPLQPASTSRLPTPTRRNVYSSAGANEEEIVPPVPAIPKAYESPKEQIEQPRWPVPAPQSQPSEEPLWTKQMLDQLEKPSSAAATQAPSQDTSSELNPREAFRHRRGITVGTGSDAEKPPAAQINQRKNLQPLRLPPLNLLPLSTPTASKIASFPAPSAEVDQRQATPPPKRNVAKTPSTPMTASKATFFTRKQFSEDDYLSNHVRSASSHYNLRSEHEAFTQSPVHTSAVPIPTTNGHARQATTPFASNSLPKQSGEFNYLRSRPSGEYRANDTDPESQAFEGLGSKAIGRLKKDNSSAHTSTSDEPETPSSGSSLRRKLSLGWKRSSSKASHASHASQSQIAQQNGTNQAQYQQGAQYNEMPPPRLPASATWSGPVSTSPAPSRGPRPSLDSQRRKPSTTSISQANSAIQAGGVDQAFDVQPPPYDEQSSGLAKSSSSNLNTMQKLLGSRTSSVNTLKARNLDPNLDKDDMVADEEMKKLASKRKDFEQAAREVDELRRRARPQERVTPAQALQMVNLNIFERGEIIDYKDIFFCGTKSAKKHVGDLNAQTANFGYDDERGDYNIVYGDHLAYRYEVVDLLGKGSFGQVVRCIDHKTGALVAIKIIRNKKRFHQQALVEVNILQKLREWDPDNQHSMINFTQSFYFRGHLCISTELLGMNLYEFIKAHEFKGFSLKLIRRFAKQMLSSLVLLKGQRVIHCDLKPENILLAHPLHSEIKVIDFGSSCFENEKVYTYIQSRFYRSPEVILGMSYGLPIDMWSLGCILAELLTGYPIFPGENEQEQLACIMEIFGPPEKHLIEKSSRKKLFFDSMGKPRITVSSKGRRRRPSSKTIQQALKCDDDAFLDFISRCLRWDPDRRLKPDEAIHHEFITGAKRNLRARPATNGVTTGASSPMKRVNTIQTPQRSRPLPEPPATSFRNGTAVPTRDVPSSSPVKPGGPRRHSTINGVQSTIGVKRASNGAAITTGVGSSLPRVAQRSASGKPDLASAAAIASLKSR